MYLPVMIVPQQWYPIPVVIMQPLQRRPPRQATFIYQNPQPFFYTHNRMPRHNPARRNSTSSYELNSRSSIEDLSPTYTIIPKNNKMSDKSHQKRQQIRNHQQNQQHIMGNMYNDNDIPIDIAEEFKENCRPTNVNNVINSTSHQQNAYPHSANWSPRASPTVTKRKTDNYKKIERAFSPKLHHESQFYMPEHELIRHLSRFIIDPNLLRVYGYPVESAIHEGCVEIYKSIPKEMSGNTPHHHHHHQQNSATRSNIINTNDGLFVSFATSNTNDASRQSVSDSGQGSGGSSTPSMDSDGSESGEDESTGIAPFYTPDGTDQVFYDQSLEKQCVRCKKHFHVAENGEYLHREACTFHWGKLNHSFTPGKGFYYQYSCCQGEQYDAGCSVNELHVWTGTVVGLNGPYIDFVHTRPRHFSDRRPRKVFALDCEMSFTGRGLEVTKITVVDYNGELVYEHFVRPDADIVDYNTRFSGITENDLCTDSNKSMKTLREVQSDLLQLFDADTILIGHGLDNDLRALRFVHKTIVDTSITFPHKSGFPYRRALKHLAKLYLNRDIQNSQAGHSSFEDAQACMDVMVWKASQEMFTRY